ncbi:MAG: LamG domain-containing protein [Phycisphaerae bacterium]|nr:LamG domain-containing protein [Phycisphaerae bacterium]
MSSARGTNDRQGHLFLAITTAAMMIIAGFATVRGSDQPTIGARADAAPIPWKMLVLIYRNVDATYIDSAGNEQHAAYSMSDTDYIYVVQAVSRLPVTISAWSAGKAAMSLKIVTVTDPMKTLNSNGAPDEYQALREISIYNPGDIYDSISMVYSLNDIWISGVASVGLSGRANSAGFSVIHMPINYVAWGATYPEEIILHEWLHNVEGYYRSPDSQIPGLHDAEAFGYAPDPDAGGSWHRWYEDYMQNRIWNGTTYVGVPAEAWQTHVPAGPISGSVPATPHPTEPANQAVGIPPQTVFKWMAAAGARWYGLQISTDPTFTDNYVDRWVEGTQYQVIDLPTGGSCYYRVRALNSTGMSPWSSVFSFTTAPESSTIRGKALRFDGVDDHVRVRRQIGNDFTLEAWIKTTSADVGYAPWDGRPVIHADLPYGDSRDFCSGIVNSKFAFSVGGPDVMVQSTTSVNSGDWVHVAAVRVQQTGTIKVYVNGREEAVQTGATTETLDTPVFIDLGGNTVNNRFFDGLMDEVRIWNRARSAGETAADMNRRLAGTESGLVGYWRMDEGFGEVARDSSLSATDGSLRYGPIWVASTAPITQPLADLDFDGDVDLDDFSLFRSCISGPSMPLSAGCRASDFDHDSDVDQSDFGIFQRCWSGANKPAWVDYVMADNFEEYPRYPLEKGVPGGFPLLNFPDISMYGQEPWGGYGANPHPGRLQKRWDETRGKLSGGIPYSEGIYEDLNKVICAQLYWSPERPAIETVRDYAAYEFSPAVADEVVEVVKIFEANHVRAKVAESAVKACELTERIEARMTPEARRAWRWRLFRIRAAIDQELYRNSQGQGRDEVFRNAYEELTEISHAKNTWPMLRPVLIPAVKTK